jgi:hypothetical protein
VPSITVTAAESGTTFNGILVRVKALTGATLTATPATAVFGGTGAQQASITTTQTGSFVYGALKTSSTTALTAAAGTTLLDNIVDSANIEILGSCRTTSATGTPGATTVGASAPSVGGQTALLEILPAGTITEDASSPASASTTAAVTITTASFTPPPGSLLVAMVSADASSATVITVSDSSGLVWTERIKEQAQGGQTGYAGVWTAVVPGGNPAYGWQMPWPPALASKFGPNPPFAVPAPAPPPPAAAAAPRETPPIISQYTGFF